MSYLPQDPIILLSYVNTKLRDEFGSLDDFCKAHDCNKADIVERLKGVNYSYNPDLNQFK